MFFAGQLSEGARGQLAGVRRTAEAGGAESGWDGGADRHQAAGGGAPRPGAGQESGERAEPAEEEEQRAGGPRTHQGQSGLPSGSQDFPGNYKITSASFDELSVSAGQI